MSLEFNIDQVFPATNQNLAQLIININGLSPGDYTVQAVNLDAQDINGPIGAMAALGGFTITAVPEPSTLGPIVILAAMAVRRRNRQKSIR